MEIAVLLQHPTPTPRYKSRYECACLKDSVREYKTKLDRISSQEDTSSLLACSISPALS